MLDTDQAYRTIKDIVATNRKTPLGRIRELVYRRCLPRSKHFNMSIPTKEKVMLDKMIDHAFENRELGDDTTLDDLKLVVQDVQSYIGQARSINGACEDVVKELERIDKFVNTGEW